MTTDKPEPSMEDIAREFPGWHCWTGIAGIRYGSLARSSPPIVVRGEDSRDLLDQIRGVEGQRDAYGRLPPGLVLRLR
ncbi:MAG TPA: hypothetical protein VMV92_30225 [Streptosporangiaceae bacterium]|nr:hypothetical protein [Streptosporangiaceae bacterium]